MDYGADLRKISVQTYKELLKEQEPTPGRKVLLQDIDANFDRIEKHGITDLHLLRKALSSPSKLAALALDCGIPEDYLVMLKRETGGLEKKPVLLSDFPGIDPALLSDLNKVGIRTSKDYFESDLSKPDELYCLCDLVRVNGIGAVAARTFYDAGYRSVADVANANASELLARVSEVNRVKKYFKANLVERDMQFCIDYASLLVKYCGEACGHELLH